MNGQGLHPPPLQDRTPVHETGQVLGGIDGLERSDSSHEMGSCESAGEHLSARITEYREFLKRKVRVSERVGYDVALEDINQRLKMFNRRAVQWALAGGRRALFFSFGLHKTVMQLELMRQMQLRDPGCLCLIALPLGVRQEFISDALEYFDQGFAQKLKFVQSDDEIEGGCYIYITNYEPIRDGKLDVSRFDAVSLDEVDCLRSFGSKTFGELLFGPMQRVPYRFVNTATPSPNDFQELIAYAHFLGIMDIGESRTRFFKRNSERADDLTLHEHKAEEFWLWVSTWALFVSQPSDLGDSDEGYDLPDLDVRWHEVPSDHSEAGQTKRGQRKLLKDSAIGVVDASREKRSSLAARVDKAMELRAEDPSAHRIIWHDLEAERHAVEKAIPTARSVYGGQRGTEAGRRQMEATINGFRDGSIQELAAKPVMLGGGCNFQRHCNWAIFLGIGFKFRDFIQAIHRLQRFGQTKTVRVDLIYSEVEKPIKEGLLRKWRQHVELVATMTAIVRRHGLDGSQQQALLTRSMGVERQEASGENWRLIKDDTIEWMECMESDSVDMIATSIPFSTQYEYTPSFNDFGHTDSELHFFEQMDFLTPDLCRVLKPGRVAAVHVKDRIVPGQMTGLSYPTVSPFHAFTLFHFVKHGFTYLGMITITTDVVRENNQTYRLGYTEQCKDGSVKGVGMPEYVMLFRKPPSSAENGYADDPIMKPKDEYSLARWQVDAHSYWRSNGDRMLAPEDFRGLSKKQVYRLFRAYNWLGIYDFDWHVEIATALDETGVLPTDFQLLPPQSNNPDVWTDIMRARTMNASQAQKGREKHICPLQIDVTDRLIERYSAKGETVFDPFAGIGTVPCRAVKAGRKAIGCELNGGYWADSITYLKAAENDKPTPTLFEVSPADDEDLEGLE